MAKTIGLFTRDDAKLGLSAASSKGSRINDLSDEALQRIGLKGVSGMNPKALHPDIQPRGAKKPLLYVLGDFPDPVDDEDGEALTGTTNRWFLGKFPEWMEEQYRLGYCVRTMPPKFQATKTHIECFRPSVIEDIERSKPKAILGLGKLPLEWAVGKGITNLWEARGRKFPVRIGNHVCWFYPVEAPGLLYEIRKEKYNEKGKGLAGAIKANILDRDLARLFGEIQELPDAEVIEDDHLNDGIEPIMGHPGDLQKVISFLAWLAGRKRAMFDVETNMLRPYGKGAKLLCIGIGTFSRVQSIAVDHPQARWSPGDRAALGNVLKTFFQSRLPKGAQNLRLDLEWAYWLWGNDIIHACQWEDTMVQAYQLDERKGTHGLNFLSALHAGVPLKEHAGVDRKRLEFEPLHKVLMYNGRDVKLTDYIFRKQRALLKAEGLQEVYREQVRRVPTLVIAQAKGFPTDQQKVGEFKRKYQAKIDKAFSDLHECPEIAKFRKRFGVEFLWASNHDCLKLFRDIMGKKSLTNADEEAVKSVGGPVASALLRLRKADKAKGTYIDPLDATSKDSVVYPDGKVHTSFNTTVTATTRLSSEEPNMQNYPKRNEETKKLRACFVPPPGHVLVAVDYAQIEARVIAMASKDKVLIKSIWDDYDIHMDWAKKIVRKYDKTFKARHGHLELAKALKAFRGDIKNQMVFPSFYGSRMESCARNLEMPEEVFGPIFDEFQDMFQGVFGVWHEEIAEFYRENFYIEKLTGGRRRGPLTWNMQINSGVQGTASDIVVNAMDRLAERAVREDKPYLASHLNIHDDLSFCIPKKFLESSIETIVREMVSVPYDFAKIVPIGVEVSVGPNWADMEEIAKFSSKDL